MIHLFPFRVRKRQPPSGVWEIIVLTQTTDAAAVQLDGVLIYFVGDVHTRRTGEPRTGVVGWHFDLVPEVCVKFHAIPHI